MSDCYYLVVVFFFNDPATTEIYTLSLHDALPISTKHGNVCSGAAWITSAVSKRKYRRPIARSEEHTSELQSPVHLVCRLLLEKKKNKHRTPRLPAPHTTHTSLYTHQYLLSARRSH